MKRKHYHALLSILFCWIPIFLFSQKLPFLNYNFKNGFNRNTIIDIHQDQRGLLWVTSESGLVSFDGNQFKYYTKKDGLTDGEVFDVTENEKGNLWIASKKEVFFYDGSTFTKIENEVDDKSSIVRIKYDSLNQYLWVCKSKGLYYVDLKVKPKDRVIKKALFKNDGLNNEYINHVYIDHNNRFWLSSVVGTLVLEVNSDVDKDTFLDAGRISCFLYTNIPLPKGAYIIQKVSQDHQNNYLIASWSGGFTLLESNYNPDNLDAYTHNFNVENNSIPTDRIWFFEEQKSSPGTYWVGTDGFGLQTITFNENYEINNNTLELYGSYNGLPNTHLTCMEEDHEGNLWFGTMKGMTKLSGNAFQTYLNRDGLQEERIIHLTKGKDNDIWLGTWGSGLIHFDGEEFERYSWEEGIAESIVNQVEVSSNGDVFAMCTGAGISILPEENIGNKKGANTFNSKIYNLDNFPFYNSTIELTDDGYLWAYQGYFGFGKFKINEDQSLTSLYFNKIEDRGIVCNKIYVDEQDRGWFFTTNGIWVMDSTLDDSKKLYLYNEQKLNADIKDAHVDEEGNMWLATTGDGIIKIDNKAVRNPYALKPEDVHLWTVEKGLEFYEITSIHKEKDFIIAGTLQGFLKISLKGDDVENVNLYNLDDGFWGLECSDRGIVKVSDSVFFVGTANGLTKCFPYRLNKNNTSPNIHLKDIRINYEAVDWKKMLSEEEADFSKTTEWFGVPLDLKLPYYKNHLTFDFIAITFHKNNALKYRFKLEGYDKDWNPITNDQKATYANLAPGKYTFKVKAANSDGVWSEEISYSFIITSPYWQTLGFKISMVIVFLLIVFGVVKYRTKTLKRRNTVLEEKVESRTQQISSQNEELATKNKEITDSILYAKNIQQGILPELKDFKKHFSDAFIFFKPKDIVSGDFYWIQEDEKNVYFSVVDCTGHGVPGAFVSIVAYNAINKAVLETESKEPAQILDHLNQLIEEAFANSEQASLKDGMDLSFCVLNKETNEIKFSGAYNTLWVVKNESDEVRSPVDVKSLQKDDLTFYEVPANKQPIGKFEHRSSFFQSTLKVEKGDQLYLFTDGYADQFGGPTDKPGGVKFKKKNLKRLLIKINDQPLQQQRETLKQTFLEWKGDRSQIDDICIIGIKI